MLRWKSSLKPAAAAPSGLSTPTLLGKRDPTSTEQTTTQIDISSATQGALMIASVTVRSTQGNLAGPSESGWKLLASVDNGNATNRPLNRAYYKVAGASESTVTWTHDSDYTSAVAIEIVGADETSIYDSFTNQASDDLGVVTVPTNGLVIAIHAKGDNGDTSSSTVRSSDGTTQTEYTMIGDAYGETNSGTAIAYGDLSSGDTNGTDYIQGSGSGSRTSTHHIALRVPVTGLISLQGYAENEGHTGYSGPYDIDVSYPAVSENDIMIMIVVASSVTDINGTPPTGWTKVLEVDGVANQHPTQGIFWKLATTSASASTGNTWSSLFNSSENYYVWVGAYSGCDTSSPIDASASAYRSYSSSWSQSITTQSQNAMILASFCHDKTNRTFVFSNGTEIISTYFRSDGYININEKIEATTGSHSRSGTMTSSVSGTKAAIALKPVFTGIQLEDQASTNGLAYSGPINIDVNIPAVSANDILLLFCATNDASAPTDSPPSDWTKIAEQDGTGTGLPTVAAYWKRASGSASATTEEWSAFYPDSEYYYIWVGAYSGCTTSGSPVDAYGTNAHYYSTSWSVSVTTTVDDAMVVSLMGTRSSSPTVTWADGTELIDTSYQSTASVHINEKLEASAGSKTRSATPSGGESPTSIAVALKP